MGLIPDDKMDNIEQKLTVLLTAIQDKVLSKKLVLIPSPEGRSR